MSIAAIVEKFDYKIKKNSATMIEYIISDADRFAAKSKIQSMLDSYKMKYDDGVRSSTSIDIRTTDVLVNGVKHRFFFKPKSAGSGAGAEITALGECFQAYACAARQVKGKDLEAADEVREILTDTIINRFTDCDRLLQQCFDKLDPDWLNSGVVIANQFAINYVKTNKYIYHRGGKTIQAIEDTYNKLKKKAGVGFNINKWKQGDIWAVKVGFKPTFDFQTLDEYNEYILHHFHAGNMYAVSLKKLLNGKKIAKEEVYNDGKERPKVKFDSFQVVPSSKKFWDKAIAKDAYITYKVGSATMRMQLRTFSAGMSGWQGEIKGAGAAGGKIGGGNIQDVLKMAGVSNTSFIDQITYKSISKPDNSKSIQLMTKFYNKLFNDNVKEDKIAAHLQQFDKNWLYSKFLSMQFIYVMLNSGKADYICHLLDSIAASSTPHSSVFLKYS